MYTQDEINLIVLSSFNLSFSAMRVLLNDFKSSSPDFKNHEKMLIKMLSDGVYNRVKEKFNSLTYREKILRGLDKKGIKCVSLFSRDYPETLKNIDDPPVLLYCKGDTSLLKSECFSIVGSRKTLPKSLSMTRQIAGELSEKFTIVSGIAEGADSTALEGALNAGGKVISVLAYGLDHAYPPSNLNLLRKIEGSGLVISEYPPEAKPKPYYFPFRNRIIAGLSRGTLVVSAGERSGAKITASFAADFGREVFAIPYSVGISSGEGCNELIKKGAALTRNVLDIFDEFGLDFKRCEKIGLSEDESAVYEIIKNSDEAFLPEIADRLDKSVADVTTVITLLTIKGLIVSLGGNRYSAQK